MTELMIDLETMGVRPDAAIIAIGAIEFDLETKTLGREFYEIIDLESAMQAGGTVSASTILWWMQQSDAARAEFTTRDNCVVIQLALDKFDWWVSKTIDFGGIWGNGATFDNVILRSAYERLSVLPPWTYRQDRCFRTVKAIKPAIEIPESGTAHKALDDAKWQARYLMEVMG